MDDISSIVSRGDADAGCDSFIENQWIATGYALAMTRVRKGRDGKGGIVLCFCHCEEGAERGTRQSIVSRGPGAELMVRLLAHSGSPRAMPSR